MRDTLRLAELFDAACELPPQELAGFLERECAERPDLRARLMALLDSHTQAEADGFLNRQTLAAAARQAADEYSQGVREGERIGRYRMVRLLGEGGMSEVWLAEDSELDRWVALKLIRSGLRTRDLLRRFSGEGQILAHLNHENIARLLDAGTAADGTPFLAMEYVEGEAIAEYCDRQALSRPARLDLFRTVCSAVQYAHQNLVVHRDLKPGNILVTPAGKPKLLDFGIAKLLDADGPAAAEQTATLLRALTPVYASPEQCRGEAITTASDVYSLGVVLYELLTGRMPYRKTGVSPLETMRMVVEQEAILPSDHRKELRGDLDAILLKALRKEPAARYATVEQFAEDIRRHQEGLPVRARKGTWWYRAGKFARRNGLAVAACAAVAVSMTAGLAVATWEARVARQRFNQVKQLAHAVLFDYNDAIAPLPGSTAVRARLVTDALTYLDRMAPDSAMDVPFQLELAAAYLRVGDVQGRPYAPNLGQTDGAMASYRKALAIVEPIAARRGGNREALQELALAKERIGNLELRMRLFADGIASHRKSLEIRERLLAAAPKDAGLQQDVAASYIYLGDAVQAPCAADPKATPCLWDALHLQQKGLEMRRELVSEHPADRQLRRELAQAYMRVGFRLRDVAQRTGDKALWKQAQESQENGLKLREALAAEDPRNVRDRRDEADQRMILGDMQTMNGDQAQGLAAYRSAIATFQALRDGDPSNAESRRDLSFAYLRLARISSEMGNTAAAWKYYETTLDFAKQLIADDPNGVEDRTTVAAAYQGESTLAEAAGNFRLAIERLTLAAESDAQWPANVHSGTPQWNWAFRLATLNQEAAQAKQTSAADRVRDWNAAAEWFERARDLLEAVRAKGNWDKRLQAFLDLAKNGAARCRAEQR